jgi:hypothetical protein
MEYEEIDEIVATTSKVGSLFSKRDTSICIQIKGLEDIRNENRYHNTIVWYPLQAITGKEQSEVKRYFIFERT